MTPAPADLHFEPPGPGSWTLDAVHHPRPVTRYWAEMHPEPFKRGFSEFLEYYGMLLDRMEIAYVNGFAYHSLVPVSEDQIPERFARADEVFEKKVWRDQLRLWTEERKPASIKEHRGLQSVDPDKLSDDELVEYLGRCRDHHAEMIYQHMRFTGAAMICVGDLLAHVGAWTGLPPERLLGMMRGAAPVSGGESPELQQLMVTVQQDPSARELLESDGDPAKILDELRALDTDAGKAMADYLDFAGYRLLDGFDICGRTALEMPDALLRAIRTSLGGRTMAASEVEVESQIADVRRQVPDEHREQFNELLSEARLMAAIRDERGVYSDIWASGIMRRAAIAAGRRLAERGLVHDPEHFIAAGFDEMVSLVSGNGGPSADELAARHDELMSRSAKDAPPVLGDPPQPPPDTSGLPPGPARVMGAMGIVLGSMFAPSEAPHEEDMLRGLAASGGVYEGTARRVSDKAQFNLIQQGDVLVTESTTEAFNILLPLLGAIVTDSGGLLSHAAIVSREYGIPGVVGTRDGTERIPDGATVRVDGDAGEVTIRA